MKLIKGMGLVLIILFIVPGFAWGAEPLKGTGQNNLIISKPADSVQVNFGASALQEVSGDTIATNLVKNGGFEHPVVNTWKWIYKGQYIGDGEWLVTNQAITVCHENYWKPHSGEQSIDLGGNYAHGAIKQVLTTRTNHYYTLSFYISPSPDNKAKKSVVVTWNKKSLGTFSSIGAYTMKWTKRTIKNLKATGPKTAITFADVSQGRTGWGMALDDIVVTEQ